MLGCAFHLHVHKCCIHWVHQINVNIHFYQFAKEIFLHPWNCSNNFLRLRNKFYLSMWGVAHWLEGHRIDFSPAGKRMHVAVQSPHASHMGGSWERIIGAVRHILDGILLKPIHVQLTHEVMAIMNARALVPVSTDSDKPNLFTPAMLLTQKVNVLSTPKGSFAPLDLYAKQWKQVQCLADSFWKQWKISLQQRRKWTGNKPNIKVGNIMLLKDALVCRNDKLSMGQIVKKISGGRTIRFGKVLPFISDYTVCKLSQSSL